ncbi:MAG TPA: YicC/YloC family endoribonuclease, partial [Archangium sp.]|uniref:YicC/YloC family endoribonuclease n=1 Tax=Archangium sp. TaxID=1872627 RepID=UPI002ED7A7BC
MLKSMTGFGAGRARVGDEEFSVELRSLNHKFCEVKVRLPRELAALESAAVKQVKDRLARGSVEVFIKRQTATA